MVVILFNVDILSHFDDYLSVPPYHSVGRHSVWCHYTEGLSARSHSTQFYSSWRHFAIDHSNGHFADVIPLGHSYVCHNPECHSAKRHFTPLSVILMSVMMANVTAHQDKSVFCSAFMFLIGRLRSCD